MYQIDASYGIHQKVFLFSVGYENVYTFLPTQRFAYYERIFLFHMKLENWEQLQEMTGNQKRFSLWLPHVMSSVIKTIAFLAERCWILIQMEHVKKLFPSQRETKFLFSFSCSKGGNFRFIREFSSRLMWCKKRQRKKGKIEDRRGDKMLSFSLRRRKKKRKEGKKCSNDPSYTVLLGPVQ